MGSLRLDPNYRRAEVAFQNHRYHTDPNYRQRKIARAKAYKALCRGDLVLQPCEACGARKVEMHHDDYTKPLVVRWLCRDHHLRHHHNEDPIADLLRRRDTRRVS